MDVRVDYKESLAPKSLCFWTVMLENTLECPLDCKEIQPVHPKGDQPWVFIGRTDVEAKTPILWPPDAKNWLIWKDPDAGKDWRQEEKGTTEDEMVRWHHQLDGHKFEQAPEVDDGQGGLAYCSPWGRRVRHDQVTELNPWEKGNDWSELYDHHDFLPFQTQDQRRGKAWLSHWVEETEISIGGSRNCLNL